MNRSHRLASAVAVALATAALVAPAAQAMPAVAGGASGGAGPVAIDKHPHDTPLANPVSGPTTTLVVAKADHESAGTGTDWNAVFAGAAGSALIIAMCAGGLSLVRRRTLAA